MRQRALPPIGSVTRPSASIWAVTYDGGAGVATDVDTDGRLIVHDERGDTRVFTGEVSVRGIYGAV